MIQVLGLKGLDHDEHNNREQDQDREFVEPAKPDMALAIAIVFEIA